ncbi:unnamed protein product [Linum trigynum]|uniref:Uncharacterized protein n=1 Tax=Linum trigynum TaxID=586398 RepID=A0AAV2G0V4_9ROSI
MEAVAGGDNEDDDGELFYGGLITDEGERPRERKGEEGRIFWVPSREKKRKEMGSAGDVGDMTMRRRWHTTIIGKGSLGEKKKMKKKWGSGSLPCFCLLPLARRKKKSLLS